MDKTRLFKDEGVAYTFILKDTLHFIQTKKNLILIKPSNKCILNYNNYLLYYL